MYIEENEQGAYLRGDSRPALARMQIMSKSPEIARAQRDFKNALEIIVKLVNINRQRLGTLN